ncbi:flavodoxin domain-containing protein [Blastococcus sp. TF02A-26]|uniref:flavodoxin domain-containing protein n=1 Tax=Blastococcus sp. TF02A-26 TaxID=2250577 RepID=UPI000DEA66FE|nr:flavodoxin domain-containing protein [Blastococcus sp. TF02A-26]RBY80795.1 flavodoxin [Blastococcus sp. TF02A-26]
MADPGRHVLVVHASAHGSTAEVAERIAARLRTVSVVVDVRPAGPDLDLDVDLDRFDAFVLGSAVHDMAWLPEARDLAGRLAPALRGRPVWLFSVAGIDPRGRIRGWMARQEVARVASGLPRELRPRDHRLFGGVVRMDGVPLWGRVFYLLARQRAGDHRDWAAIEAWADGIAAALPSATATPRP